MKVLQFYISLGIIFLKIEKETMERAVYTKPYDETNPNKHTWMYAGMPVAKVLNEDIQQIYLVEFEKLKEKRRQISKGDFVYDISGTVDGHFRCPEINDGYIEVFGFGKLHIDNLRK
jgi:hypothetical protein